MPNKISVPDIRQVPVGGKRILLRAALNLPLVGGIVADDLRLDRSLETVRWLMDGGAKVGIIGHLGREGESLRPVYDALREQLPRIEWTPETLDMLPGDPISALPDGSVTLFENTRRIPGEVENDPELGKRLARCADIFVNDAFADSHRNHASIVGIPRHLPSFAGIAFQREIEELSKARSPAHPALCILGGAKFETKEPLIKALLDRYDHVLVAGALANDFFAAAGYTVGRSLVSGRATEDVLMLAKNNKIIIPIDVEVDGPLGRHFAPASAVMPEEKIYDAGPATIAGIASFIHEASFILWNGPLGTYEEGYTESTETVAKAIAQSKATTIVGGGDTVAAIRSLNIDDRFTFLSTAGGAMIDFLTTGTLPGIDALVLQERI